MKTTLRKGQITESGFEILDMVELKELDALGIWAGHQKSGAQVFHVLNDDKENLFAFAFATIPEDSTGAAHILEHSVLCGSEHYPLKDAFLVLAQGSLQTFLNAWTFPDKTVYPASSVNEHDYFNLMAVYADAVFRPLLSEWTFMQEGHRLFFPEPGKPEESGGLSITGVVYNEMKGAYSSLDAYAGLWSVKAVLPDTPYAFESGGDPECIPFLSWEGLREFHRTRYSPGNCRIFLAGNIPTEKQLSFLDEKYLSVLPPGKAAPPVGKANRWRSPQTFRVPCPAGAEQKATVFLSWLCSDVTDSAETIALAALTETLLGHDGSPLTRALIESGLGEDLTPVSGLEGELRETVFTAGIRGVKKDKAPDGKNEGEAVEALILDELKRLVREGIPKEEIEAALLTMEFSHREIRRSHGPYSLVWLRRSLQGWIHGTKPWDSLLFMPGFTQLKERLAAQDRYFESLISKYFLDNPHRALVVVEPQADYLEKKEAELAARLAETEVSLTDAKRREIVEKAEKLERFQETGDSPEALAAIPHLSRKDLSPEIERVPREIQDAAGIPALVHGLFTNGISYTDLAFPLDILNPEDYFWLPFFSRAVVSMGLPGLDYGAVSSLLARTVGGFHITLQTGSVAPCAGRTIATPGGILDLAGRDWLIYRLKALNERIAPAQDLALRLITEADFSDLRRVRDLVLEMKNDIDESLAPSGHGYTSGRSGRFFSRAKAVNEIWNGLTQIDFVHKLARLDTAEISRRLTGLRDALSSQAGLIVNQSGEAAGNAASLREIEKRFSRFGPPRPRNPAGENAAPFLTLSPEDAVSGGNAANKAASDAAGEAASGLARGKVPAEVYASPSLQVGFAALSFPAAPFASNEQAVEAVLAHQLSTGALWEDIRMKGGAYGAFAHPDTLEGVFSFSTHRDPDPLRSLGAFTGVLKKTLQENPGADILEKAVIGSFAKETHPQTAAKKGAIDFLRFLYGIEDDYRAKKLKNLIAVSENDITGVLSRLASYQGELFPVIIAGTGTAAKAAQALGVEMKKLPV